MAVLAVAAGTAASRELIESERCRAALGALQDAQAEAVTKRAGASPAKPLDGETAKRLEALRRQAARACLGGTGDPTPHAGQPAPAPLDRRSTPRPLASPVLPPAPMTPAPVPPAPPLTVLSCDSSGCWASDGSRLQQLGPHLLGPRGLCTQQGLMLNCPP
ncbi:MAG TPA: hypothetical protein VGE16_07280 [Albitalea sp.]